jgi:hypothetical protein
LAELELLLAKAAQSDAENVTDRWQADMNSVIHGSQRTFGLCRLIAIFLWLFPVCHDVVPMVYNANESPM